MRPSVIMIGSLKWWNSAAPPAFHCQVTSTMHQHQPIESTLKQASKALASRCEIATLFTGLLKAYDCPTGKVNCFFTSQDHLVANFQPTLCLGSEA